MNTAKLLFTAIGSICVIVGATLLVLEPFGNSPTDPLHGWFVALVLAGVASFATAIVLQVLQERKHYADAAYRAGITVTHRR